MLNLKDIRKDINFFKKKLEARYIKNSDAALDELLVNDENLRKVLISSKSYKIKETLFLKIYLLKKTKLETASKNYLRKFLILRMKFLL